MAQRGRLAAVMHHEAAGGVALFAAAIVALVLANSPLAGVYGDAIEVPISVGAGQLALTKTAGHWINDGLMAIFFFTVGLEIKRELATGELSTAKSAALPFIAALGGMIVPAVIFAVINAGRAEELRGWAIPCATDIAFAVGVLALAGSRIPSSLKIFLLALAIIDDLGAIVIIAMFYTADLSPHALALAAVGIAALAVLNRSGVTRITPYAIVGLFVWVCVLKSGVHATLAGVATALAIPLSGDANAGDHESASPSAWLQSTLHPWVTFAILPLFALANAGVPLAGVSLASLLEPLPLGIIAGLVLGKPVGVALFSWAAISSGVAARPAGANWTQILGVGVLAGIGFTMSLFIGMLAFSQPEYIAAVRLSVLVASIAAGSVGYAILRFAPSSPTSVTQADFQPPR